MAPIQIYFWKEVGLISHHSFFPLFLFFFFKTEKGNFEKFEKKKIGDFMAKRLHKKHFFHFKVRMMIAITLKKSIWRKIYKYCCIIFVNVSKKSLRRNFSELTKYMTWLFKTNLHTSGIKVRICKWKVMVKVL